MNKLSLNLSNSIDKTTDQLFEKSRKVTQCGSNAYVENRMERLILANRPYLPDNPADNLSITRTILLSAALAVAGITAAPLSNADTQDVIKSNNQLSVSVSDRQINYTEIGGGQFNTPVGILDSESGQMSGIQLSFSAMGEKDYGTAHQYIKLAISHSEDMLTYTGASLVSISGRGYGSLTGTHYDTIENVDLAYGIGFDVSNNLMVSPMIEAGYRSWLRTINSDEFYTHRYYAAGLLVQYSPIDRLVFSAAASSGQTYAANIDVTPIAGIGGFSGALGSAPLQKFSLSVDYGFMEHFHGHAGVDVTHFSYGISDTYKVSNGYVMWEPNSITIETVINIGLGYAF